MKKYIHYIIKNYSPRELTVIYDISLPTTFT